MSKSTREIVAELEALREDDPASPAAIKRLRQALRGRSAYAASKVAQIIGEFGLRELASDLETAFERLITDPLETDRGCMGKAAIADALYRLDYDNENLFLRGIRYRQMEPVWGGSVDTACALRVASALGLVAMNYRDVLVELADLLADPEAPVRAGAAQALAYNEDPQGVPLLRLKVLTGDKDPNVISECFSALMKIAPAQSTPFVAGFLDDDDDATSESAALALGESRTAEAFNILKRWCEKVIPATRRRAGLFALAMLRREESFELLLSFVTQSDLSTAKNAIAALGIFAPDEDLKQRVAQAASQRKDADLSDTIDTVFEQGT